MDYEHKGTSIKFSEKSGEFMATVGPRLRHFPSLAAARKAIEAHIAEAFEPFQGLVNRRSDKKKGESPHFEAVTVIGIEKATGKKGWGNRDKFIFSNHQRDHRVIRDTPENRATLTAYHEFSDESERIKNERQEKLEKLRNALKFETLEY